MSTAMEKPLNGAGLAVVNQIFNQRLSRLEGGGGGGVDWAETPYTGMTHFNNSSAFGCAWLETEKISSMARHDMERFMGAKIYLETWVKVKENWRDNVNYVRNLGYRED